MKRHPIIPILISVALLVVPFISARAQSPAVVRAVLFYSPTCGHCQYVISETILPLMEQYGEQLQILGLDVTQPAVQPLYLAALDKFRLERGGVPFLVIDNLYLAGSVDIPEAFPGLVEAYLARGGTDWPDIPGLREAMAEASEADNPTATDPSAPTDEATVTAPVQAAAPQSTPAPATVSPIFVPPLASSGLDPADTHSTDWTENFASDPAGNTLAVIVLAGMLAASIWAFGLFRKTRGLSVRGRWSWIIPALSLLGFGVASYLAYVETTQATAICGPVGDCNTVQQSEYARLFGILPIGILGMLGYVAIVLAWFLGHKFRGRLADLAVILLFAMTIFGTLFSIYLTFLEPFVIGATCAWCLTSAVLMTLLMLLSIGPAKHTMEKIGWTTKMGH